MAESVRPQVLSVLVPAYNEENTIAALVQRVLDAPLSIPTEVIVVDDCSADRTAEVMRSLKDPRIKKVFLSQNRGKGGALKEGLKHATGHFVVFQDADLEYDPSDYEALLRQAQQRRGVVIIGNRFTKAARKHIPRTITHYIGNRCLAALFSVLYQLIPDAEPCYKLFRTEELRAIDVVSNRFEYDIELMCKCSKAGYRFIPVPIKYEPRTVHQGKKIRLSDGFIAAKVMIAERFRRN